MIKPSGKGLLAFRWLRVAGILAWLLATPAWAADLLVIVNAGNTSSFSESQIADLYSGKENRLPNGRRAVVIDQSDRQEAKKIFYQRLLGLSIAEVRAEQARLLFSSRATPPREAFSSREVAAIVATNPDAIGFIEAHFLLDNHRVIARWPQ